MARNRDDRAGDMGPHEGATRARMNDTGTGIHAEELRRTRDWHAITRSRHEGEARLGEYERGAAMRARACVGAAAHRMRARN